MADKPSKTGRSAAAGLNATAVYDPKAGNAAKTSKTGRSTGGGIRHNCSLWSQRGKGKPLATTKARKSAWGSRQNTAAAVPTPEVAAATRLWVGTDYYLHLARSLSSLALPRDPLPGATTSRRVHDAPQTVTASGKSLTPQALPSTSKVWLLYPSFSWAQVSKWALISFGLSPLCGWGTDTRGTPTSRAGPETKAEHKGLSDWRREGEWAPKATGAVD